MWFFSETSTKSDRNSTTEKSDYTDFSVSRFQQVWVLISRRYPVKALCSQWFVSPHLWRSSHVRSLRRRLHPRPHGMCLGVWLHYGGQEGMAGSKAIDFYALSRGVPRKPARNLIEIAQRKSQICLFSFYAPDLRPRSLIPPSPAYAVLRWLARCSRWQSVRPAIPPSLRAPRPESHVGYSPTRPVPA